MGQKPVIAITTLYDPERGCMWMLDQYCRGIARAGGIPVILPIETGREDALALLQRVDGMLFPGGQDILPLRYGEDVGENCGLTVPTLDQLELTLFALARERDLPVLGICRGLQLLNVAMGGTLYQHIPGQLEGALVHDQKGKAACDQPVHRVELQRGTRLQQALNREEIPVNSLHHQGVKGLAPELRACAVAGDGLVEAAETEDGRVLGVQWHPELLLETQDHGLDIFRILVKRCGNGR